MALGSSFANFKNRVLNRAGYRFMKKGIRWGLVIFITPVLLWLFLLIVLPHLDLLIMSFRIEDDLGNPTWSVSNYLAFFQEPIYWLTFTRTAGYSILVTLLTFIVALPVAFFITKVVDFRYKGFLTMLLLLPFWVSELVRVYGWMILLRESGVINHFLLKTGLLKQPIEMLYNDVTMVMGLVYTCMLFMVIPLISVLDSLDDGLIEAAYDLGANMWTILVKIIIPHSMPGIVSGSIVVFMLTLGNYLTPNLMGGKNSLWFTEQIYNQFIASFNWNQGSAFGFLLLLLSSLVIWTGLKLTKQKLSKVVK
jgi:spermidine/putrescine transport system permease protein